MPLIDAYLQATNIKGGYNPVAKATGAATGTSKATRELEHKDWSEIYTFRYTLADDYPKITITKPVDIASNDYYLRYLQNRSRERQKGKATQDALIDEINIELCRWVDTNRDGIVDEFQVFLEYTFKKCRVLQYDSEIDFEADDIPEETLEIGFREMHMKYYHPEECSEFQWDFTKVNTLK